MDLAKFVVENISVEDAVSYRLSHLKLVNVEASFGVCYNACDAWLILWTIYLQADFSFDTSPSIKYLIPFTIE